MKVSVESPSPTQKRVSVGLDAAAVEKEFAKSYKELSRHAPVRGFRPGKAPRNVLERLFGKTVKEEVKGKLVEETVEEAFQQEKIKPVAPPVVEKSEMGADGGLEYIVLVDVKPDFEPRDYIGIELKPEPAIVTEQEVDDQIEALRNSHATLREPSENRPLRRGDIAIIERKAADETGTPLPKLALTDEQVEVGSSGLLPQLEEALDGMMAGETRAVGVDFPADHPVKMIAGKRVTFHLAVKGVKEKVLPALDDEFAKDVGEYETVDALRAATRERLLAAARDQARTRQKGDLVRVLLERNRIEAPRALVENEIRYILASIQIRRGQGATDIGEEDIARLRGQFAEPAAQNVRRTLALEAIAEKEGIVVADPDLEAHFEKLATTSGKNVAALKAQFAKPERQAALKADLREERVLDFLLERAKMVGE